MLKFTGQVASVQPWIVELNVIDIHMFNADKGAYICTHWFSIALSVSVRRRIPAFTKAQS